MAEAAAARSTDQRSDRLLLMLYGLFAVAASGRSCYQLIARPADAMLAYWLSAVAASGYVVGLTLLLAVRRAGPHSGLLALARAWCVLEFGAVLVVGSWTVLQPSRFPAPTVWSYYGVGYLLLPAVLPLGALAWLRSVSPGAS